MDELEAFILEAKSHCYVGHGQKTQRPCRLGSHDLSFTKAGFSYLDSYFGGTDFMGQETVWRDGIPVWGMNYYGKILNDDLMKAETAGRIITSSLQALYTQGRFLGGFKQEVEGYHDNDQSDGTYRRFTGWETIHRDHMLLYQLDYHGGIIRH
jgi:hypothetical protein